MRGCAAGIPQTPDPATVASGPTGSGTWNWDTDGSYGDWYTGHELGHTYGRFHIGSGCGESADDPNYPFPHGQIANPDDAFVGLDVGDPAHAIPLAALPGVQWHDVMSYCVTQWLSSYTYAHIHDRLVAENAMAAGPAPPVAGASPPAAAASVAALPAPALPGAPAATLGANPTPTPFATAQVTPVPALLGPPPLAAPAQTAPTEIVPELAAPAPVRRGSKTLEGVGSMATLAAAPAQAATTALPEQPPPEMAEALATLRAAQSVPTPTAAAQAAAPQAAAPPAAEVKQGDFLHVVAQINITRGTGKLTHTNRVQQALVSQSGTANHASLRFLGSGGSVVGEQTVPVRPDTDPEPNQDVMGLVDVAVPFPNGATAVELLLNGQVVDRLDAGDAAATPNAAAANQPASPVSASRSGDQVVVRLPTGGPAKLSYNVQVSPDDGKTWHTIAVGVKTDSVTLDAAQFKGASQLKVQVTATDGLNTRPVGQQTVPLTGQ